MAKRAVSIYDIAKLAGVSTATVSNVLNQKGNYSEKTRELVERIAREQGYVANFAAKSLRESSTKTVAILTPDVSNDFFSTLVLAVEGRLREAGYSSYICYTANDPERESSYIYGLLSKQVDGIVYIGGTTQSRIEANVDIPVVHIDHTGTTGVAREVFVGNDLPRLSYDMTATLFERGCKRVALASVSASLYRTAEHDQAAGYYAYLEEHNIVLDKNLVLEGPHKETSLIEAEHLVSSCLEDGYSFDGVVALGDRVALGVVNALKAHGIAVGKDVLVIGMDDSIYSRISTPTISTVRRHTAQMAEEAMRALLEMLGGAKPSETHIVVDHEVIERETTLGF